MKAPFFIAVLAICSIIGIISCQKELALDLYEAEISLTDSSGACLPIIPKGVFKAGLSLTSTNYLEVKINVSKTGDYLIETNSVNGFSFKGQGRADSTGLQNIKLIATGKPLEPGVFPFTIKYGANSCPISVTVTDGSDLANYSLKNASGNCPAIDVKGIYMQAAEMDTSNYTKFIVHVAKTGTYSIQTDTKNGISFSANGNFTDTGFQTITLQAIGTPTASGDYSFAITGTDGSCTFPVTVKPESNDPAVYSINCLSTSLAGDYLAGTNMSSANTATIQVIVTKPGKYNISTTTVNGISFSATGRFTVASTTEKPVVLTAAGKAEAKGQFTYPVTADGNTCSFQVPFSGPAEFTLSGGPGACTTPAINGVYNKGVALTAANTIVLKANVTSTGAYNISTNTVNGSRFSGSGTFTNTGTQDIVLTGTGTPAAKGTFNFTPQIAGACSFDVVVGELPVEAGKFSCKIDGVYKAFVDRAQARHEPLLFKMTLALGGYTDTANGGAVPQLEIFINNNDNTPVTPGSYNVDGYFSPGYRIEVDYHEVQSDGSVIIWNTSSSLLSTNPPFTIKVTEVTSNRAKGTFSGEITNILQGSTKKKKVTEGVFDLPIK